MLDRITAGTRSAKERLTAPDAGRATTRTWWAHHTNGERSHLQRPRSTKNLNYNGAPPQQLGAITVLYGGQALNIVALSYTDTLQFTLTACDSRLPDVERLTEYCRQALDRLEDAICSTA
jgi:hypothetical protein